MLNFDCKKCGFGMCMLTYECDSCSTDTTRVLHNATGCPICGMGFDKLGRPIHFAPIMFLIEVPYG